MNRSRRDEGDKHGRGPGLIGEKTEKTHSYEHAGWKAVDSMLKGDHPTTHIGTMECAGGAMGRHQGYKDGGLVKHERKESVAHEQREMVEGRKARGGGAMRHSASHKDKAHGFAAGGVGKVRKGQY